MDDTDYKQSRVWLRLFNRSIDRILSCCSFVLFSFCFIFLVYIYISDKALVIKCIGNNTVVNNNNTYVTSVAESEYHGMTFESAPDMRLFEFLETHEILDEYLIWNELLHEDELNYYDAVRDLNEYEENRLEREIEELLNFNVINDTVKNPYENFKD